MVLARIASHGDGVDRSGGYSYGDDPRPAGLANPRGDEEGVRSSSGSRSREPSRYSTPRSTTGARSAVPWPVTAWSTLCGSACRGRRAPFASDRDDHLIRNRIAEVDGTGIGIHSRLEFELVPGFSTDLPGLSANLAGEMRYFRADGEVTQRWYDADGEWTGEEIRDLPDDLESLQFTLNLGLGIHF